MPSRSSRTLSQTQRTKPRLDERTKPRSDKFKPHAHENAQPTKALPRTSIGRRCRKIKIKSGKSASVDKEMNRQKQQRFRDRIRNDPEMYDMWRQKKHQRYLKRKAQGKIKIIGNMPESKKRTQRRKWKANRRAFRARQKSAQQSDNFLSFNTC